MRCSGDVMCLLWSTKRVFIPQKTGLFIVTAVNIVDPVYFCIFFAVTHRASVYTWVRILRDSHQCRGLHNWNIFRGPNIFHDASVVCDPSYLAVVFGIFGMNPKKKKKARAKNNEQIEEWSGSGHVAAALGGRPCRHSQPGGRYHATVIWSLCYAM
jgi:hypothetical protein